MNPAKPDTATMRAAADAVATLATTALAPAFLLWDKAVNLGAAEWIWNLGSCGVPTLRWDSPGDAVPGSSDGVSPDGGSSDGGSSDGGAALDRGGVRLGDDGPISADDDVHALRVLMEHLILPKQHGQAFQRLCEHLWELRRTRWPSETFLVLGLDARRRGHEIVFHFDLTWDDYRTGHPCEIVWDANAANDVRRN